MNIPAMNLLRSVRDWSASLNTTPQSLRAYIGMYDAEAHTFAYRDEYNQAITTQTNAYTPGAARENDRTYSSTTSVTHLHTEQATPMGSTAGVNTPFPHDHQLMVTGTLRVTWSNPEFAENQPVRVLAFVKDNVAFIVDTVEPYIYKHATAEPYSEP
jgi:hypothetical protein